MYIKNLKEKQRKKNNSCIEEPAKIIKIPKRFTHDFDFSLLESRPLSKKGTVRSPLKYLINNKELNKLEKHLFRIKNKHNNKVRANHPILRMSLRGSQQLFHKSKKEFMRMLTRGRSLTFLIFS